MLITAILLASIDERALLVACAGFKPTSITERLYDLITITNYRHCTGFHRRTRLVLVARTGFKPMSITEKLYVLTTNCLIIVILLTSVDERAFLWKIVI